MSYSQLTYILVMLAVIVSCGTEADPDPNPPSQEISLDTVEVFTLEIANEYLFAGTKYGVHRTEFENANTKWTHLGPEISSDTSRIGDILFTGEKLLIVVRNTIDWEEVPKEYVTLYETNDFGENWEAIDIELVERDKPYVLFRLAEQSNNSVLFGDGGGLLYKSNDDGRTWGNQIDSEIVGFSKFLTVSENYPDQIWTGGWINIFFPYLAKSEDGGDTWTLLNEEVNFGAKANAYDAVVFPQDSEEVLVGFGGTVSPANVIRKTTDGGQTWQTVLEGYNIRTLQNSSVFQGRVYASGLAPEGTVFAAISNDFGDSWHIEIVNDSVSGGITHDLAVAEVNGGERLFLATTHGVHSVTFEE